MGSEERHTRLLVGKLPKRNDLLSRVNIPIEYLKNRGIEPADLKPFMYHSPMEDELLRQEVGNSYIDKRPLAIFSENYVTVILPTAISIAIREFVINTIIDNDLSVSFDNALSKRYAYLFYDTPLLGGPLHAPVYWKNHGNFFTSSLGFKVDEGYFISFQLFQPSITQHEGGGFKEIIIDGGSLTEELQRSIDISVDKLSKKDGFKEGIIILVGCGWGKGYATDSIKFEYSNWRFEHISVADLMRLSWLGGMSPEYFWKIQDGLTAIENHGVRIKNVNGILNLIGWVRENKGHFIPHSQLLEGEISLENPLMVQIPTNLIRDIRCDCDKAYDKHCIEDNIGGLHEVQYVSAKPLFLSESSKKTYASMTDVKKGILTSVYEGKYHLWISIKASNINDRNVEYQLWDMACEWLHRIGRELDKYVQISEQEKTFKVYAEFQDYDPSHESGKIPEESILKSHCEVQKSNEPHAINAMFKNGFLDGFRIAENTAERLFVWNIIRSFLVLLGEKDVICKTEELLPRIVENKEARSFHFFRAQNFIDYVRESLPKNLIEIDEINDGIAKLGLGWRSIKRNPGGKNENKIFGKKECNQFLNKVVDILISEISELLSKFDRENAIIKIVRNCEKAGAEEDHWVRTSAAIIGLHGRNEETIGTYIEQTSKFAGAGIAGRVLVEMALCICPLNDGEKLSDIELSKLIAKASLLVRYGGLSDAIRFSALPPELYVSALGDILFKDEFGDMVVQPLLSQASGDKFVNHAPKQVKNYDDPGIIESTKESFGVEFWDVWVEEMGFNLDEARIIIGIFENYGVDQHSATFKLTREEVFNLMRADKISDEVGRKFIEQFTLRTREHWDSVPEGFSLEEIYPWRFGRRLSFVTRPILAIDNSENPALIISPGSLRKGFAYLVNGTFYGRFKQSFYATSRMRNEWWGKASEGHSFNSEAANKLRETGWSIKENIGLPEMFNEKLDKDYGDVDILAWKPNGNKVLVIECKDLSFARNYSEIAALLSIFQGAVNEKGKGDKLKVHLDRVDMIKQKIENVKKFTGLDDIEIKSCLVCSGIVPMQFAKIEALESSLVCTIDELISVMG